MTSEVVLGLLIHRIKVLDWKNAVLEVRGDQAIQTEPCHSLQEKVRNLVEPVACQFKMLSCAVLAISILPLSENQSLLGTHFGFLFSAKARTCSCVSEQILRYKQVL